MAEQQQQHQRLILIPWDCESPDHVRLLEEHRVDCGWDKDKVTGIWRDSQRAGTRRFYWLVEAASNNLKAQSPNSHSHSSQIKSGGFLLDTCTSIMNTRRDPSNHSFCPIGHIAVSSSSPEEAKGLDPPLELPSYGVVWVKSLYILTSMRSNGLGSAAMDAFESMAPDPPLSARVLMLDTCHKDDQMRPDFSLAVFGYVPKMSNQEWYERRGYCVVRTALNVYHNLDISGKYWDTRAVFMRKDLT